MSDLTILCHIEGVRPCLDREITRLSDAMELCCHWAEYGAGAALRTRREVLIDLRKRIDATAGTWGKAEQTEKEQSDA